MIELNVALNGKLLEEIECFGYLGSQISIEGKLDEEVNYRMNEEGKLRGGTKKVLRCKSLRMMAKRRLYDRKLVSIALYGAETERKRLTVAELKSLKSMCRVTRIYEVRNEKMRRRTGIVREVANRAERGVLRCRDNGRMEF